MKLHLPSSLRKALLACLAALALPSLSLGSGVFASAAFCSFLLSHASEAADSLTFVDDEDAEDDELFPFPSLVSLSADSPAPLALDPPGGTDWDTISTFTENTATVTKNSFVLIDNGGDFRILADPSLKGENSDVAAATIVFTQMNPAFKQINYVDAFENVYFKDTGVIRINEANVLNRNIGNIYVENSQLWFTGTADYDSGLFSQTTNPNGLYGNLIIGKSNVTNSAANEAGLNNAALRIAQYVEFFGSLTIDEDGAIIAFQGSPTAGRSGSLGIHGEISGNGDLCVRRGYGANDHHRFALLSGGTLNGNLALDNVILFIGEDQTLTINGLNGTANSNPDQTNAGKPLSKITTGSDMLEGMDLDMSLMLEGQGSGTLILNVAHTPGQSDETSDVIHYGNLEIGEYSSMVPANVLLIKRGEGTQEFAGAFHTYYCPTTNAEWYPNDLSSDITIEAGKLLWSSAVAADTVILDGDLTIQGTGSAEFRAASATINGALSSATTLTVSGGSLSMGGGNKNISLTNGLTISGKNTSVTLEGTGTHTMGNVIVNAGTEFVLKTTSWTGGEVSGAGKLVIDTVTISNGGTPANLGFLTNSGTLGTLEIRNGGRLQIVTNGGNDGGRTRLARVSNIVVQSGSNLWLGANGIAPSGSSTQTLHLAGTGTATTGDGYGALHVEGGTGAVTFSTPWGVTLDNNATIFVAANKTLNLTAGNFNFGSNRTLTFDGSGIMQFRGSVSGTGVLQINAGQAQSYITESATSTWAGVGVKLNGSTAKFLAGADTTIAWLEGTAGEAASGTSGTNSAGITLTLKSNDTQAHTYTPEIHHGWTGGSGTRLHLTKLGTYTQSIGAYKAGELHVGGGTLNVNGELNNYDSISNYQRSTSITGAGSKLSVTGALTTLDLSVQEGTLSANGAANFVHGQMTVDAGHVTVGKAGGVDNALTVAGDLRMINGAQVVVNGELVNRTGAVSLADASVLTVNGRLTTNDLSLEGASTLNLGMVGSWTGSGTHVSMGGGSTIALTGSGANTIALTLGTLTVNGKDTTGHINWSAAATGGQVLGFTNLTGDGNLDISAITGTTVNHYQRFAVDKIYDYNGLITGAVGEEGTPIGLRTTYGVFIREISQSTGMSGSMEVLGAGAASDNFRKRGGGSFLLNRLTITNGGTLYMKYNGDLGIGAGGLDDFSGLALSGAATLYYTNDDSYLTLDVSQILEQSLHLALNVDEIAAQALQDGYYLGIVGTGTKDNVARLKSLLSIDGGQLGARDWTLQWRDNELYLVLTRSLTDSNLPWDSNWGSKEYSQGPKMDELDYYSYDETLSKNGGFDANALALVNSAYDKGGARTLIQLTGGGGENAAVLGGQLYTGTDAPTWVARESYIYMNPADADTHYHLLVGASSGVSHAAGEGGFLGNTHLQVEDGRVDYIVGANHVTNGSLSFRGNTYISFMGGELPGSIVGGSALTGHASASGYYNFEGDSSIFIYCALGNVAAPATLPGISIGGSSRGAAFTAIVGGNAWVHTELAQQSGAAIFRGNSEIIINLSDYGMDPDSGTPLPDANREFAKALVGGNYVAASGSSTTRRDAFEEGHAWIRVTAGNDIVFSGGVAGASRVQSVTGDTGTSEFMGDTVITLAGGTYTGLVAGGFWLENAAAERAATFTGGSSVELRSGDFRAGVAGGSYTTGSAGSITHRGNSLVSVRGGSYSCDLVGGSLAESFSGELTRTGGSQVDITGGSFGEEVLIIGGDKLDFAAGGHASATESSVSLTGADVSLTGGVVAGGSYLAGSGGSAELTGSSRVTLTEATVGGADAVFAGGGYLAGSGLSLTAAGSSLEITGGSVSGTLVGGHYAAANSADSTAHAGTTSVSIVGAAQVSGSIFGGHYLQGSAHADAAQAEQATSSVIIGTLLAEGDTTTATPTITGNVYGGSYMAAGDTTTNQQGSISVLLYSGTLSGHVYAAGKLGDGVTAHTAETEVVLTDDIVFSPEGNTVLTISGGYEGGDPTASVDRARLNILSANAAANEQVNYTHFNEVEVNTEVGAANIASATGLEVLGDTFTKTGGGLLSIANGLKDNAGGAYTGKIVVQAGELVLGESQSLEGGLAFNLSGRKANNSSLAYLQAGTDCQLTAAGSIDLELIMGKDEQLQLGSYYLASGLADGITRDMFAFSDAEVEAFSKEHLTDPTLELELLVRENKLYLRVHETASEKWIWGGTDDAAEDGIWSDAASNWNTTNTDSPNGSDVYFTASGADANGGVVQLDGTLTPSNVYVEGGTYTFVQKDATTGGLNLSGILAVGGKAGYEAELTLQLANTRLDTVQLKDGGTLMLAHEEALITEAATATKIAFQGGVLGYSVTADTEEVIVRSDLSSLVDAETSKDSSNKPAIVRIRVGDPTADQLGLATAAEIAEVAEGSYARWGTADATRANNSGVKLALETGLEKSGSGTLLVEWQETEAAPVISGSIKATDGTLLYALHAAEGSLTTLDMPNIHVGEGATVGFSLQGTNAVMRINSPFTDINRAGGTAQIGTEDNSGLTFTAATNAPYLLYANNSGFSGSIRLVGSGAKDVVNTVYAASAEALGGKNTNLWLAGRHLILADDASSTITTASVEVEHVNYLGGYDAARTTLETNAGITLKTDKLVGEGTLVAAEAAGSNKYFHHTIESNDISGFTGTLVAMGNRGAGSVTSSWTLRGDQVGPHTTDPATGYVTEAVVNTTLAGDGLFIFDYASQVVLAGSVGDDEWGSQTSLENQGAGELILTGDKQATGALITHAGAAGIRLGYVNLNGEVMNGQWQGRELRGDGDFVLTAGTLGSAITAKGSAHLNVQTRTWLDANGELQGTLVDAGRTQGSMFDNIYLEAHSQLTNVAGNITVGGKNTHLTMRFGEKNMGSTATAGSGNSAMIQTVGGNVVVRDLGDPADPSFVLDFSEEGFFKLLTDRSIDGTDPSYLYVLQGGNLTLNDSMWNDIVYSSGSYLRLLLYVGLQIEGVEGGSIRLGGKITDVYIVDESHPEFKDTVGAFDSGYGQLDQFRATVVGKNNSLDLTLTGAATAENGATANEQQLGGGVIHNLVGLENSSLGLHNGSDYPEMDRVTVILDNHMDTGLDPAEANGMDTTFKGTITSDPGVDIRKMGSGTLSIGSAETGQGGLKASGDVVLAEGSIVLQGGSDNSINTLVFNYTTPAAADEKRGLTLTNGTKTSLTTITESSSAAYSGTDNHIILTKEAELVLTEGSNELRTTRFTGGDGTGVLTVGQDAQLTLTGGPNSQQLDNVHLKLASDSLLDLRNSTQNSVNSFSGKGTLRGYESSVLTITGSNGEPFSGELAGDGMGMGLGGGTLNVAAKGRLILDNVTTSVSAAWSLVNSGDLTIDVSGNRSYTYFQDITLAAGSKTTYRLDTDYAGSIFKADSFTVESPAEFVIESTGRGQLIENDGWVTLAQVGKSADDKALHNLDITLQGVPFLHYEAADLRIRQEKLQLQVREITENRFELPNMEKNARAGATLFWAASSPESAAWDRMSEDENSDLYKVTSALAALYYSGDEAAMSRTLAAGAGASVSVLGSALAHDIQRQLGTIRNRTTTMAAEPSYEVYDSSEQIYHMWINAEGSNFKTKANSLAPGYSLSSWGGTVGIDTDWDRNTTIGLAISAMYGDLKPEAADRATGNLDTTYLTAFARHASGAWLHTFIVSGGVADVTLNRTVDHALGSYKTLGNTSGFALGALYEVGYAHVMNTEGTFILQTVFNTQITHATISGYTESGSDAGLRVGDISHDVVTFGLGARAQAIVGENAYNRTSILEARALVKLDAGDRSGTATNALVNGANVQAEVESARVGAVGVELGAGLTVPLGASSGSVFVDTSLEVRSGYTGLNATAGYRFSF